MDWFKKALETIYSTNGLVGIAIVVALLCGVITWAVWMGLDVGALLRLVTGL